MWKMGMKVEGGDPVEQTKFVQVLIDGKWGDLFRAAHECRAQPVLIHHWHIECLHQRARILSEALLPWDQWVPVVPVFQLPLLHIVSKSHIVMWRQQQTGPFAFKPFADGFDLLWCRLLLGNQMI